ncbi:Peptidase_M10_C domain-containing protein [Durusdinium trenchii]|uniref:Peptidase_M10_C domain-containing protein n=1 Tax=Durusdinium trenchii TaxID=1381693 RepID=A0ABP0K0X1_9DINO
MGHGAAAEPQCGPLGGMTVCVDAEYDAAGDETVVEVYREGKRKVPNEKYVGMALPDEFSWARGDDERSMFAFLANSGRWKRINDCFGQSQNPKCNQPALRWLPDENGRKLFAGRCKPTEDLCSVDGANEAMDVRANFPFNEMIAGGKVYAKAELQGNVMEVTLAGEHEDFVLMAGEFDNTGRITTGVDEPWTVSFNANGTGTTGGEATAAPTDMTATEAPTEMTATESPTEMTATESPTEMTAPTSVATDAPTMVPTSLGTDAPTETPTSGAPTATPTDAPTMTPTTEAPTESPTTGAPTESPTAFEVLNAKEVLEEGNVTYAVDRNGVMNMVLQTKVGNTSKAYIGAAISDSGQMVNSSAIIAQLHEDGTTEISEYLLTSQNTSGIVEIARRRRSLAEDEADCSDHAVEVVTIDGEKFLRLEVCAAQIGDEPFAVMGSENETGSVRQLIFSVNPDTDEFVPHGLENVDSIEAIEADFPEAEATSGPTVGKPPSGDGGDDDSNTGAIVGGVIGGLAAIALIALAVVFAKKRKGSSGADDGDNYGQYTAPPPKADDAAQQPPPQPETIGRRADRDVRRRARRQILNAHEAEAWQKKQQTTTSCSSCKDLKMKWAGSRRAAAWCAVAAGTLLGRLGDEGLAMAQISREEKCDAALDVCADWRYDADRDVTIVLLYKTGKVKVPNEEFIGMSLPEEFKWTRGDEEREMFTFIANSAKWGQINDCFGQSQTAKCNQPALRWLPDENGRKLFAGRCKPADDVCLLEGTDVTMNVRTRLPFNEMKAGGTDYAISELKNNGIKLTLAGEYETFAIMAGEFDNTGRITTGVDTAVKMYFGDAVPGSGEGNETSTAPTSTPTVTPTDVEATDAPTQTPTELNGTLAPSTEAPTEAPTTGAPTEAPTVFEVVNTQDVLDEGNVTYVVDENGRMNMVLQTRIGNTSKAWLGVAISDSGNMIGSSAIIAQLHEDGSTEVDEYLLTAKNSNGIVEIDRRRRLDDDDDDDDDDDCEEDHSVQVVTIDGEKFLRLEVCETTIGDEPFVAAGEGDESDEVRQLIFAFNPETDDFVAHSLDSVDNVQALEAEFPGDLNNRNPGGGDGDGDSNTGAIVGGVIGGLAAVAIIAAIVVYARKDKGEKASATDDGQYAPPPAKADVAKPDVNGAAGDTGAQPPADPQQLHEV